jgi:hypothetical protein
MKEIDNYLVCFVDILGFKSLIRSINLRDVLGRLLLFIEEVERKSNLTILNLKNGKLEKKEKITNEYRIVSDSIFYWRKIPELKEDNRWEVKKEILNLLQSLQSLIPISIRHDFPLRIGVAFGECAIIPEKDIFIGKPIIDAVSTESVQNWIGLAFHESCENLPLFNELGKEYGAPIVSYDIPIKQKNKITKENKERERGKLRWTIDWPSISFVGTDFISALKNFYQEKGLPPEKYENTIKFYQYMIETNPFMYKKK